jgi:hypothetical protein
MLESELVRLREENVELKRQVGEISQIEDKRKKAEQKAETLERKVRLPHSQQSIRSLTCAVSAIRWMT